MKTIGLLGGMSWHSSADYYRLINEQVAARLGGHHSARVLLASLDFEEVRDFQRRDAWDEAAEYLALAGRKLQEGGAELLVMCTNLMHRVAPQIEAAVDIPFLHIADAVGKRVAADGHAHVGLLGARWVMEETFYTDRLRDRYGVEVSVPNAAGRALVDRVIFDELTLGRIEDASRTSFVGIIEGLEAAGAQAVVLACTELELLVGESDSPIPVIDSTRTHATAAVDAALMQ
jgi:aspartate racemase